MFLLRSEDWCLRLTALMEELGASLASFHSSEHREAGGLDGIDRDGSHRRFPLLSVSVAAVEVDGAQPVSAEHVAERLRHTKHLAKAQPGCACLLVAGDRLIDLLSRVETPARTADSAAPLAVASS